MNKRSAKNSKKKILEAALKVFSEYGYKGASIRMIASAAQISIGGVYLYFRNKEDLCLTLIKQRFAAFLSMIRESIKDVDDPVDAITTFIKVHIEYARNHKELILTQGREQGFTFGIEIKRELFKEQRAIVERIIQKGITSGCFEECNVREATKIIIGTIRGFVLSIVVDPDNLFLPEECAKFMLSGLLRRTASIGESEQHKVYKVKG